MKPINIAQVSSLSVCQPIKDTFVRAASKVKNESQKTSFHFGSRYHREALIDALRALPGSKRDDQFDAFSSGVFVDADVLI